MSMKRQSYVSPVLLLLFIAIVNTAKNITSVDVAICLITQN